MLALLFMSLLLLTAAFLILLVLVQRGRGGGLAGAFGGLGGQSILESRERRLVHLCFSQERGQQMPTLQRLQAQTTLVGRIQTDAGATGRRIEHARQTAPLRLSTEERIPHDFFHP